MKNKGFKVTAIILALLISMISHPFLSVNAMEIRERPIVLNRTQNITNATGIWENSQISYNYSVMDGQTAIISSVLEYPVVYCCDIIINLRQPVKQGLITFTFTTPATSNYSLNFIVEHGRVTTFNQNTLSVQMFNTDVCYIKLIFSLQQLMDNYNYSLPSTALGNQYSNNWVQNGYTYFQIMSATMSGASEYEGAYQSELNSIIMSVDGIEGLLNTLINNTSYISTISTNISSLNTLMNNLLTTVNNIDSMIDTISWNSIPVTYKGWTTDYQTFDTSTYGYHDAGYYVLENPDFSSSKSSGIYKLRIPIGNSSTTINNIKFYQRWTDENNFQQFQPDLYIYHPTRQYIEIIFTVSETYHQWPQNQWPLCLYFDKRLYKYSAYSFTLEYILPTDIEYWTLYKAMKDFTYLDRANTTLDTILYTLQNMNVNITNQQVTNVTNQYDTNINYVYNVENNLSTQLDQQMQQFTPDNTNILQRLNDSSILLKSVINQINGIEIFSIPIAVTLVGIVLMAIIG